VIEQKDGRMQISGDVTMDTVGELFVKGLALNGNGNVDVELTVDCKNLGKVDSSAVSLMLVWLREARSKRFELNFINVPQNLLSLANLYGVSELLGIKAD
jgi:phospholipid transport system transporter-binding protein